MSKVLAVSLLICIVAIIRLQYCILQKCIVLVIFKGYVYPKQPLDYGTNKNIHKHIYINIYKHTHTKVNVREGFWSSNPSPGNKKINGKINKYIFNLYYLLVMYL